MPSLGQEPARFPTPADMPAMRALWSEAFEDTAEYLDFFFSARFRPQDTMVLGTPVASMLFLLPLTLCVRGERLCGRYVYAVATRRSERGRGLSTRLLRQAAEEMARQGEEFLVLVPASPSLFDFYGRQGFFTGGIHVEYRNYPAGSPDGAWAVEECLLPEFISLRRSFFVGRDYYQWDSSALSYAWEEAKRSGGQILKISSPMRQGFVVCSKEEQTVFVKECTLTPQEMQQAAGALCAAMGAESCRVRFPGEQAPYGMALGLTPRAGELLKIPSYLGLTLD